MMKVSNFILGALSGGLLTAAGFLFISAGYENSFKRGCLELSPATPQQCQKQAAKAAISTYKDFVIVGAIIGGVGYSANKFGEKDS